MAKKTETVKEEKIEREYIIPLRRKYKHVARYKKTPKAIKSIKEFLVRHMKIYDGDLKKIKLDNYLNEYMWDRGIKNPPHKIKVKAIKQGDIVKVELVDYPTRLKFKKLREEKSELASQKIAEKKKAEKKVEETKEEPKEEKSEKEKVDEKEKVASTIEAGKELEKVAAKKIKHSVGGKTKEPKRPRRQALQK